MNTLELQLVGERLLPLASGALWWPSERLLCVSDLHLGKAERTARRKGTLLPPYECDETLERLETVLAETAPETVVCLGDSFDDRAAGESLDPEHRARLRGLMTGRHWIWIAGNHDPQPLDLPGDHVPEFGLRSLRFRHIARNDAPPGEISGHYHPKARLRGVRRPCFLADGRRVILPAFGAYTGGLDIATPELRQLMGIGARAILTGPTPVALPVG